MNNNWVGVEKQLFGEVIGIDSGERSAIQIRLSNGATLIISANEAQLVACEKGHHALLYVTAEESLKTRDLRNINLISITTHTPRYDEQEFQLMVERGTKAWVDVPDGSKWVEDLRGNSAS